MKKSRKTVPSRGGAELNGAPYFALIVLLLCLFATTSVVTFSPTDWPNPHVFPYAASAHNACGKTGAWIAFHTIRLFGIGAYAVLCFGLAASVWRIIQGPLSHIVQRFLGVIILGIVASTMTRLLWTTPVANLPLGYAGSLGMFFGSLMREYFSGFGTFLILAYSVLAALLFIFDGFWMGLRNTVQGTVLGIVSVLGRVVSFARWIVSTTVRALWMLIRFPVVACRSAGSALTNRVRSASRDNPKPEPVINARRQLDLGFAETKAIRPDGAARSEPSSDSVRCASQNENVSEPTTSTSTDETATTPVRADPIFRSSATRSEEKPAGVYPAELDDWVLPPMSLLEDVEFTLTAQQESVAREKAKVLERTLNEFKVEASVVAIDTGPVITMFELSLTPGIKVSQINNLERDIARALKAPAVRVVAPIPGKNTVGIEVPRIDRERVRFKELMAAAGRSAREMALPLFLGKDASGNPLVMDLTSMPHLLIAGTTGSGKSVCINSIIMSVLMTQRPDRVKMILMDPKMVELSAFKEVPHLMCPIVNDMQRAERILDWACTKMDERYALLAEAGVKNIADFNKLTRDEILERFKPTCEDEIRQIPMHLPYLVLIVDELADLMMTAAKEVEYHLARLAQKSRAVGIHIVVATQRPEAKVVTGLIKSNLPCRVAFRVAARMDSRIVLDQNGAEGLLGQGDMLFLPPGSATLVRAQGTFVADEEVRHVVNDLRNKGACDFHPELIRLRAENGSDETGERDELFDQAVEIILESQRGSVSLLQRRLTVGYSRASRLIDQMAVAGLVGEYKGSQAREVLMTLDEWKVLKAQVNRELTEGYAADQDETSETPSAPSVPSMACSDE